MPHGASPRLSPNGSLHRLPPTSSSREEQRHKSTEEIASSHSFHAIGFGPELDSGREEQQPMNTKARILVIDDEKVNFDLLEEMLQGSYVCIFASEGPSALHLASTCLPDVILLDAMMPGMDGFEVLSALKADASTSRIPVIFMTSMEGLDTEIRGFELGAIDYIKKSAPAPLVRARIDNHVALKTAQDELARQAMTDPLTGIANRRQFDQMLRYEYARHARNKTEFSVIMLDIDNFKAFNDSFGHTCGDACIQAVAGAIQKVTARSTDLVARYGGEEFVILLPETSLDAAICLAQKIQQQIGELTIVCGGSKVVQAVTASLGVAGSHHVQGDAGESILRHADTQMYAAKVAGRNRVCASVAT
ncbi:MAG TPA: diguanylate cyclase [Terracidiphilus sp.]|nr:diguanylate cyclase [Terracidiphilus sp.]